MTTPTLTRRLRQTQHDTKWRTKAAFARATGVSFFLVRCLTFFPWYEVNSPAAEVGLFSSSNDTTDSVAAPYADWVTDPALILEGVYDMTDWAVAGPGTFRW